MNPILKVNNSELSFRLKLNYNNVYSRLKMLLGKSSNIFADVSTRSVATTWYSPDNAEYTPLTEAPKDEESAILAALNAKLKQVKKELNNSSELAPFADDILEVPGYNFIFYKKNNTGGYDFVLAGWGCKMAHTGINDGGGIIKRISKAVGQSEGLKSQNEDINIKDIRGHIPDHPIEGLPNIDINTKEKKTEKPKTDDPAPPPVQEVTSPIQGGHLTNTLENEVFDAPKKKGQRVVVHVLNQKHQPVEDEAVVVRTPDGEQHGYTDANGDYVVGNLPYHSSFGVRFPDLPTIQERTFEVEPKVERYEACIKKYVSYSPVLFVDDQNGNVVEDYNVKVVIDGQDSIINTGDNGMIQLPTMQDGQKFIVIDSANYANSQEYSVNQENVKTPYHFTVKRTVKPKVGITVIDKNKTPMEGVTVDITSSNTPCQQTTNNNGRAEFPADVFTTGDMDITLFTKNEGTVKSKLKYSLDVTEYSIHIRDRKPKPTFNWRWLMLLPLLLLLCGGGYWAWNKMHNKVPTIKEMETGVCLILGEGYYFVDLELPNITVDGNPAVAYFNYDDNAKEVSNLTFDRDKATVQYWWGTGFLISDEGLIATNKHVADPAAPEEVAVMLKKYFQKEKNSSGQLQKPVFD